MFDSIVRHGTDYGNQKRMRKLRIFSRFMPPLRDDRHPPWTAVEWIALAIIAGVVVAPLGLCVWELVGAPVRHCDRGHHLLGLRALDDFRNVVSQSS